MAKENKKSNSFFKNFSLWANMGKLHYQSRDRKLREFYFSCFLPCADKSEGNFERIGNSHQNGSPGGTRTPDPVVNSHLLYRLSYRGATRTARKYIHWMQFVKFFKTKVEKVQNSNRNLQRSFLPSLTILSSKVSLMPKNLITALFLKSFSSL